MGRFMVNLVQFESHIYERKDLTVTYIITQLKNENNENILSEPQKGNKTHSITTVLFIKYSKLVPAVDMTALFDF